MSRTFKTLAAEVWGFPPHPEVGGGGGGVRLRLAPPHAKAGSGLPVSARKNIHTHTCKHMHMYVFVCVFIDVYVKVQLFHSRCVCVGYLARSFTKKTKVKKVATFEQSLMFQNTPLRGAAAMPVFVRSRDG